MAQGESFVYSACPGWGDHDYCAIKTIVKDGKIERTERIIYSDPEATEGHICQKGCLAGRMPYDPNRLKYPMKRAGERGEGKWERISWDQALDEIAAKLTEIGEKYGHESVVLWGFNAGAPPSAGFEALMPNRWANLFGCTYPMASVALDNGPFYAEFYAANSAYPHVIVDPRTMIGADLIYLWGCNPIENQMRIAKNLVAARDEGATIVDIGLVFDGTAGFADEFYGVRPGSDGHMAMAFVDYILQNDCVDFGYLLKNTVAAYLVDGETGLLAKDAEGNYLVYDNAAGAVAPVAAPKGDYPSDDIAFYGSFEYEGKTLTTALTLLKEEAAKWSAEAVAEKVGLPAETITALAKRWAEAENAFIATGYGLRYYNATETCRIFNLLGMLTGRLGKQYNGIIEGLQTQCWPLILNDAAVSMPNGPEDLRAKCMRQWQWFAEADSDDSPYKAFIKSEGNPVHQQPDRNRWLRIFSHMELVVDIDVWLTDTGELADYVLPDAMAFERQDIIMPACYNHVVLQEPAIEPAADVLDPVELWSGLGKRMGYGEYFDKTNDEWCEIRLQSPYPLIASVEPKIDFARLKAEKMIRFNAPPLYYDGWVADQGQWGTATGRLELYAERLKDLGLAIAHPRETIAVGKSEEYPFQFFSGRQRFFMQSSFTDDPINVELSGGSPATRLNPKDARALGFEAGDMVEVYNEMGHVVTRLEIDECVPAGTVHTWFGWRARQFEEGTYAECVTTYASEKTNQELEEKWAEDWLAAGNSFNMFTDPISAEIASSDCYWDSWCNIRKYEAGKEA